MPRRGRSKNYVGCSHHQVFPVSGCNRKSDAKVGPLASKYKVEEDELKDNEDTNHIEMVDMTKSEASKNIKSNATLKQGNAKNVTFAL